MAIINGDATNNVLSGTDSDDIIRGLAGNDTLNGNAGNDELFGDDGNDSLDGGTGADTLIGGAGVDTYYVDNPLDNVVEDVNGGLVDKVIFSVGNTSGSVSYTLAANVEHLQILGGANNANVNATGNELNNFLIGNSYQNSLFGLAGNDTLEGLGGGDFLYGGTGNDIYRVRDVTDSIIEDVNAGIDTVETTVSWILSANVENLLLKGATNPGGGEQDQPINGTGNELNNTITGNDANNVLYGKQGNDTLLGEAGNDRIVGGVGNDVLTGGVGADRFIRKYSTTAIDTITDFETGEDLLSFSASGFGGGLAGVAVLNETQFTIGSAATDSSDRFIYNSATGGLFFDADGIGGTAQVQIFTLSTGLAMTNADIFIFA